eukprot:scaffold333779_cov28-Prasinocladus_malaysianus.AAC.1
MAALADPTTFRIEHIGAETFRPQVRPLNPKWYTSTGNPRPQGTAALLPPLADEPPPLPLPSSADLYMASRSATPLSMGGESELAYDQRPDKEFSPPPLGQEGADDDFSLGSPNEPLLERFIDGPTHPMGLASAKSSESDSHTPRNHGVVGIQDK